MVAMHDGHDHDGNRCPGCQFRKALAGFLAQAHEDGGREWHWAVGDLRQAMHAALLTLDAMDAAAFDDDPADADDDPAADAADAIADLGSEIEELWHALVGQGDD
jgi:hypothetical protein